MLKKLVGVGSMALMLSVGFSGTNVEAATKDELKSESEKYIGVEYVFGGTTPAGFDCSGFTQYVYNELGIDIPRTTLTQWQTGTSVSKANLEVGDLVFFQNTYRKGISHVGIYAGNGHFYNATSSRGVQLIPMDSNYWGPKYAGAKRVADLDENKVDILSNGFLDLSKQDPTWDAVKDLMDREVIHGYSDGTFRPDQAVTRDQAAAILNRYLGYVSSGEEGFKDMKPGDRFYDDITAMREAGILSGYGNGEFKPKNKMTRTEMAIIVERAFKLKEELIEEHPERFKDVPETYRFHDTIVLMSVIDQIGYFQGDKYKGNEDASRLDFTTAVYNGIESE